MLTKMNRMPTFLVIKGGAVSDTIRGANASALRSAVSSAVSESSRGAAASGPVFESKGYRLGNANEPAKPVGGRGSLPVIGNVGGAADGAMRFAALYFTTLFSFDAYAAAEASPFSVKDKRR
jgi:thioredoxin 1